MTTPLFLQRVQQLRNVLEYVWNSLFHHLWEEEVSHLSREEEEEEEEERGRERESNIIM